MGQDTLLRVQVRLDRPIHVGAQPVLLDGLLSALAVQRATAQGHTDPWSVQHDIPVDRYRSPSGQWVFKASMFRPINPDTPFSFSMVSRINVRDAAFDIEDGLLKARQAAPNPAGGTFKTSFFPVLAQWAQAWEAYVVGDIDAIGALLKDMTHLGGRRSIGMGAVSEVTVQASDGPAVLWTDRPLPEDFSGETTRPMALAMSALQAPYWRRSSFVPALVPL